MSGSVMSFDWESRNADAILQAWYGGQAAGDAITDVLFGDYNPAGRMPLTTYMNDEDLPDFEDYSMKGRTSRYTTDVLFPFGFGLSYSKFDIGTAKLSKATLQSNENTQLSFPIENIGKRDGTEIVQVYVRKLNDTDGPLKTLKAFKRIDLKAGEKQNITIDLPASSFEFYDAKIIGMNVTPGEYEVFYGKSWDANDLKMTEVFIK